MLKQLKPYIMPLSMIIGSLFHSFFTLLSVLTPYIVFVMLFFTYCKLDFTALRLSKLHFWLLFIQIVGSIMLYILLLPLNSFLAQAAMICVLAPTATAAPVITGMLGGSVAVVSAYSVLCNISIAIMAPIIFPLVNTQYHDGFTSSFIAILKPMFLLLFLPMALAYFLQRFQKPLAEKVAQFSSFSFYLWSLALCIVTGKTVHFLVLQPTTSYKIELIIAFVALLLCVLQFYIGRKIGSKYQNVIAGGQSLGQKNTVLAIWMAQMYLHPLAAIGPGAYILWQNLINSYQIWAKNKNSN